MAWLFYNEKTLQFFRIKIGLKEIGKSQLELEIQSIMERQGTWQTCKTERYYLHRAKSILRSGDKELRNLFEVTSVELQLSYPNPVENMFD